MEFGRECAGMVSRAGIESGFVVGQRVCGLTPSAYKTHARMKSHCAVEMASDMSFIEAASFPVAFITAYYALEAARVKPGESILVHSAAGGTGQAAIQIARHFGVREIFATVSTHEKKQLLMDQYGIPGDHIFSSRDTSFASAIGRMTKNGVDIVLNSLSGEGLIASWKCIAPYGRFLEIGKRDIIANNSLPMLPFLRNVTYSAIDLSDLITERPHLLSDAVKETARLLASKEFHLIQPLHSWKISEVDKALRYMQTGQSSGKIVLEIGSDLSVPTIIQPKMGSLFDRNKTYVIAGGLGGIGRSISRWMVDQGARNFILLSRSGPNNSLAKTLIKELEDQGANIMAPVCDVSNTALLKSTLNDALKTLPSIGGCIQAAMVLRVSRDLPRFEATTDLYPRIHCLKICLIKTGSLP
jgi:NADPH:quinone reductase-like Zn-dependent oxidoreductase